MKGTLSGADLDESSESCKVTNHGDFRLTDEFILRNAPYESNYGEKLTWSDTSIDQTSIKGDSTEGTEDRIEAAVTAIQETKTVHAHYRTTVDGEYVDLTTHVGDNYGNNTDMTAICAAETDASGCHFSHWEVHRTETGDVIAKSYYPQFDLCMMDDYYITPVYGGPGSYAVTLDPGDQDDDDHYWAAWTWEGSSTSLIDRRNGVKVLPCEGMTYKGLYENVRFIKVHNSITDLGALISSNSTSMPLGSAHSDDLRADENDGRTYVVTGHETLLPSRLTGEWQDTDADPSVTLTWIDYTRNRWTDENGLLYPNGNTDLLYSDFEIAFDDDVDIRDSEDYQLGVVYELCAQLPASATFDQSRDYNQVSDPDNLKAAISAALGSSSTSGSYIYNPSKPTKTRSFQLNAISTANLTIKDRIVFGKAYKNAYKVDGSGAITGYTNSTYLMKVTAYLIKNEGETSTVTLSNSVYICLKAEAAKEFAVGNNAIIPALSE